MNKTEARKLYGKERCQEMHEFLNKLSRYYAFPYSDETLCDFIVDLKAFTGGDLKGCLKSLENRESDYPLKFNEIKNTCLDVRSSRIRFEKMEDKKKQKPATGIPMPKEVKEGIEKLVVRMTTGDPTSKEGK